MVAISALRSLRAAALAGVAVVVLALSVAASGPLAATQPQTRLMSVRDTQNVTNVGSPAISQRLG